MNQNSLAWINQNPVGSTVFGCVLGNAHGGGFFVELAENVVGHVDILNFIRQEKLRSIEDYPTKASFVKCKVLGLSPLTGSIDLLTHDGQSWDSIVCVTLETKMDSETGLISTGEAKANDLLQTHELVFVEDASAIFIKTGESE